MLRDYTWRGAGDQYLEPGIEPWSTVYYSTLIPYYLFSSTVPLLAQQSLLATAPKTPPPTPYTFILLGSDRTMRSWPPKFSPWPESRQKFQPQPTLEKQGRV